MRQLGEPQFGYSIKQLKLETVIRGMLCLAGPLDVNLKRNS